ncbi:MAG: hypothetical protein FJ278_02000, partial [Planctomycetes bacterium]|nr:hypothetical protein [Planctomycetota bacterium]
PAVQSQVRDLALRTRDPYALWYSGAAGPVDGLAPKPPVDLPQSIHYRHIGWVIFNTSLVDGREGATFAMRSGPFYAGHQHDDQNGFVIHAYGEKLAIDSGYYDWYGSEHFKKYSSLTRAHNTLLVNGQDQAHMKPGADGRIAAYFDSPAYGYTVGDASDPDVYLGQLKRFDRRVLFIKPGFVVIHDVLESSGEPARYDWLLHTVAPIETDAARQTFSLASGAAALRGRFLAPALSMAVVKGYPVEPVDGYSTRPVPPEKYAHEWTLTATPAKTAVQEDFLTALQIRRLTPAADPEARIEPLAATNALGVRITQGDDVHLVLFRKRDSSGPMECETLASDGQVAAVRLVRQGPKASLKSAFAVGATFVRDPGGPIVSSTVPADWALLVMRDGKLATVNVGKAASVLLSAAAMPRAVLVDGKSVPVRFAPKAPFISINLSEGEHTIAYGEYPEAVTSRPMPKLTIRTERVQGELDGYEQRQPDDCLRYWWGAVAVGKTDRYRLILEGWQHVAPPNVTCDGKPANVKAEGGELAGGLWLTEGSHFLGLSGRGNLAGIRFLHEDRPMSRAEMLPKSFTPAKGSILIEAENAAVEGEVKGKVMEKVAASGGVAHCVWDTLGQWAEWDVGVEREGRYELLVRGASEHDEILRELRLDGRAPQLVRFAATGGWCRTADDWRYFRVLGADGQPVRFHLAAGKHRLRLEHFGGSMNIDLLAWQPVE